MKIHKEAAFRLLLLVLLPLPTAFFVIITVKMSAFYSGKYTNTHMIDLCPQP